MADTLDPATPTRRRRSDARRSIEAIVEAARTVLGERPDASMDDLATAAGVTRQTVYAHFPSRDALILAVVEAAAAEALVAIAAADLDDRPPADALVRFLDICWQILDRYPFLLDPALTRISRSIDTAADRDVAIRLERLIQRGQHTGDFDRTLPTTWLVAAILGLCRTAADQVTAGQLTATEAATLLRDSTMRLCNPAAPTDRQRATAEPATSNT
ncbi:TetR/AcrR family transcriptional regulator [Nocardia terpenica]|uniref:TetR/AcrR family transcriptional regulator n=1 Tax=Nocardia terpenica TaxID=455432 RepID=UPI0002FB53D7|nr:TetR/AcrR family transcriptional regulator [Nocardia terpenica]NQE93370.1 TetR/AcrR family transcriptional regulator [Nocardia terpenica]